MIRHHFSTDSSLAWLPSATMATAFLCVFIGCTNEGIDSPNHNGGTPVIPDDSGTAPSPSSPAREGSTTLGSVDREGGPDRRPGGSAIDFYSELRKAGYPPMRDAGNVRQFIIEKPALFRGAKLRLTESVVWEDGRDGRIVFRASIPIRLYGLPGEVSERAKRMSATVEAVSVFRANMKDLAYLTPDGTLKACTSTEASHLESLGHHLYVGENLGSQVLLHARPDAATREDITKVNRSAFRLCRGYRMDIVVENMRVSRHEDTGYYMRSALLENEGDSDSVIKLESTVDAFPPVYFRVDVSRRQSLAMAELVSAVVVHISTGTIVAAYGTEASP